MHTVAIRQEIIDRVMARRGRIHGFDSLDPETTALVVIDMQSTFCEPGAPGEVAVSRKIVAPINALTRRLRPLGVPVIWVLHANTHNAGKSDWEVFFNNVVADDVRLKTIESFAPGRQTIWSGLEHDAADVMVIKNRYRALANGSSNLERVLRNADEAVACLKIGVAS
jgi:ureidoacrylate peracid hydrolase